MRVAASLRRVLAQVEVTESNSMIEAFWRSMKNHWLFPHSLDSIGRLRTLVAFFVEAHNTKMLHAASRGQTPNEVYFGTAAALPRRVGRSQEDRLRKAARREPRGVVFGLRRAAGPQH